jgi:hypothetical protein
MEHTMARPKSPTKSPSPSGPFDLSTRYMAEEVDVPIIDPVTKEPTGMTWTIASQFSKEARAAAMGGTRFVIDEKGNVKADGEEDDRDGFLEQIIAATRRWSNFVVSGEPLPCTPENARALLTDVRTAWIRPQVQTAYLSLSRFFG